MKFKPFFLLLILSACAQNPKKIVSDERIELFCQDLNVILQKIDMHAANIANKNTTRTAEGGYYKVKMVKQCTDGICEMKPDASEPIRQYDPGHPDADKKGYVSYPPLIEARELAELTIYQRLYDMVIKTAPVEGDFFLNDPRSERCFRKYASVEKYFNYRRMLGR